jgi:hypothetical protein
VELRDGAVEKFVCHGLVTTQSAAPEAGRVRARERPGCGQILADVLRGKQ